MGNIFYQILSLKWPFKGEDSESAQQRIIEGGRPDLDEDILNSTDPVDIAIIRAMKMCHVHNPRKRASAREVADFLSPVFMMYG